MDFAPNDRLRMLCAALEERSADSADLEIVPTDQCGSTCSVRLSSPLGPVALMSISRDAVTVTTRSGPLQAHAGDSKIVDHLGVDLTCGFNWDSVECESADELAYLLVKHMRRRVRDSDPASQITL